MQFFKLPFEFLRLLKFGAVGISGVFVNSGLLWLLATKTKLPFYLCSFIAIETSIITNFLLNDRWTWSDRRRGSFLSRLLRYNASTAFSSIFITMTMLLLFKEWAGIPFLIANLLAIGCGMVFNFVANYYYTYGQTRLNLPKRVWIVLFVSLAVRLGLAAFLGAGFDEAYYYSYSIRPDLSYFDHPPFVGFLAGFFPYLTGLASPFTIRLGAVLLFTASSLLLYRLALQLTDESRAFYVLLLLNSTPLFFIGAGTMILPDAGLLFFWCATLLLFHRIFIREEFTLINWLVAGVLTGLAMLSKYHGALLGLGAALFLILCCHREFLRLGVYWYGLTAFAAFLPVIVWNVRHDFISFAFQGARAAGGTFSLQKFLQALGGQAGYLTPFLFFPMLIVIVNVVKSALKGGKRPLFFLLFGVLPTSLMLGIAFFKPILPHWTLPGYIVLLIPLAEWFSFEKSRVRLCLLKAAAVFVAFLMLTAALHTRYGILHLEKWARRGWITEKDVRMDATLDMVGWPQVGRRLIDRYANRDVFLFTHKWFLSGEIDLAVKGKLPVMCFNAYDARGFALWDAKLDMRGKDGVLITSSRFPIDVQKAFADYFRSITLSDSLVILRGGIPVQTFYFYECRTLLKRFPLPYGLNEF
ncbi:MAG: GtrA family protein [candidate division KSB1 bacterium]|nr:GtrA family protein [candidate division KSB1 bacterium]